MWFGSNEGADIPCEMTARGDTSLAGQAPDWAIYAYEYKEAHGTVSGSSVVDITVAGHDSSEEGLVDPSQGRFEYAYYLPEASRDSIMSDLVMSHEALPFIAGATDAKLGVYRIGGGMMQQYVQRIADVMGDDGQRRTVTARGCAVMAIASGVRHERTDEPTLVVCRSASASGVPSGAVEFVSFSPRMTLKGRPSLAVVRGSWEGDEAMPMVVAVEAEGSSSTRGLVIEAVATDSGTSDVQSAMRAAWASLDAESLDSWEGTLVVPGFLPGLIERTGAHAGAGAVIAVYDERYGLSGYKVLVKEVRADYGKRTTELTVTSHSPAYASTVPDTAAAVQMAGDLSTGSGMLYRMQYARAVTQTSIPEASMGQVEVSASSGAAWWPCEDVTVGYTPTRAVVTARIRGAKGQCTDYEGSPYAVAQIRIGGEGGTVVAIDPYKRPDLYTGQALIVQVDCPRGSGPTPPTPTTYVVRFYVATDSVGYGSVSAASASGVEEGTAISASSASMLIGGVARCTATPEEDTQQYDYSFVKWTGADDSSTSVPSTVTADTSLYAHFSRTPVVRTYTVRFHVATDSIGYGSVSAASIANVAEGSTLSATGQAVLVGGVARCTATPEEDTQEWDYSFVKWTGADDSTTAVPSAVTADLDLYAHFSRVPVIHQYTAYFHVATDSIGYGSVSVASVANVPAGTAVTVAQTVAGGAVGSCTATPEEDTQEWDYGFVKWTGADDSSTPAPTAVNADVHYYAHFSRTPVVHQYTVYFHVATDSIGYGSVSAQSIAGVLSGTAVTVAQTLVVGSAGQCTATPEDDTSEWDYGFLSWTGADDASTPAPTSVTGDTHYFAHFSRAAAGWPPAPMSPSLFTSSATSGASYCTITGWREGMEPTAGYVLSFPTTNTSGKTVTRLKAVTEGDASPWAGASAVYGQTIERINARAFTGCAAERFDFPALTTLTVDDFKECTAVKRVDFGPLSSGLDTGPFPDWTFYDTDGTTVLTKTAANLKNSTFVGTYDHLVKQP